jgi:hypothetical protein
MQHRKCYGESQKQKRIAGIPGWAVCPYFVTHDPRHGKPVPQRVQQLFQRDHQCCQSLQCIGSTIAGARHRWQQ